LRHAEPVIDPMKTRVFIVDDHPLVRESLANLIAQQPDMSICGEAEYSSTALAAIATLQPDVAVVDLSLGDGSGLDLIRDLRKLHPRVAVLVLSMHDESWYAERALRAGARGYVMKRAASRDVLDAIRRVREGRMALTPDLAETLAAKLVAGPLEMADPVATLSDRELDVFRLLGQGRQTRQIADALHLSMKTVQAYCARIKDKLGLNSANELLREAVRWLADHNGP